ncbi:UDP-N-acetylmuramate--L-alanine ligase [Pectinatus cerevisiiphilus]|uniref:UDP-N-acetylmuramate--L-alanine ligase n=2 Tax=Pectinatus cerevisiiphilus TaxID=86956 RepID=A0A4R3KCZ2_9FIRM|nr:UDP-N-acetylmuramate--L-alanine ligase [Pectinatus cerevisiiphilus]TCS80863.1 UDP-N-acetylmuramate--L-alanine ligase [Pectinatus cerevisiiphilus]
MLNNIKKIHFIGIGGIGMSAIAEVLLEKGYTVTGSDLTSSAIVAGLQKRGAIIYKGHRSSNVNGCDAVVKSSAIAADNPELLAAVEKNIKVYHRSDILAELLNSAKGIAVAGSHGKTTTSSMVSVVLDHAGVDPTVVIGGVVDYFHGNARLGKSEYVIAEADESDGSFLKFYPYVAAVTNIEDDHMDHYGTMENIIKAFRQFISNVQPTGTAVLCLDHENVRKIAALTDRPFISYGIVNDADYMADNIKMSKEKTSFDVLYKKSCIGRIELNIPGRHNILNALATVAICRFLGISMEQIAEGFKIFHGADRRFQTKKKTTDYWIVDDYAHHPTEIKTTLDAAKQTKPKRLICIFQPHRYTRTKLLAKEFGNCFSQADVLIFTDIYSAGEKPIPGISGKTILDEVEKTGKKAVYIENMNEISSYVQKIMKPGDLIITMGAGNIFKCGEELAQKL